MYFQTNQGFFWSKLPISHIFEGKPFLIQMSVNCSLKQTLQICIISAIGKNQQKCKVDQKNPRIYTKYFIKESSIMNICQ